jgi:cysteine synthase A
MDASLWPDSHGLAALDLVSFVPADASLQSGLQQLKASAVISCGFAPFLRFVLSKQIFGRNLAGLDPVQPDQYGFNSFLRLVQVTQKTRQDVTAAIGNTPLIKLRKASEETGCTILGKAEFMNPGQSVKDRAALFIIKAAVAEGRLRPGGTIVEGTAGNTGIGLAMVANALGFRTVIVIPETQSQEKKDTLKLYGAELVEVPAVPYKNPNNYVKYSGRLAERLARELPAGAIWANQFDNVANRQAHVETTAEEIWNQTGGKVDAFVCSVGSGGTLGGVSDGLKAKNKNIRIALADPLGAALYSYYKTGVLKAEGTSITEGIGQGRVTKNLEGAIVDDAYQIPDSEGIPLVFELLKEEGLCLGGSSGINVAGAIRLARELGPGKVIVTMLCDLGTRYQSKLFNPAFLRSKNIPVPDWMESMLPAPPSVFEAVEPA